MSTVRRVPTSDTTTRKQISTLEKTTDTGKVLKQGDSGPAVLALQKQLHATGHFKGPFTGYFGPITEAALKSWEKANGKAQNGVFGSPNAKALKSSVMFVEDGFKQPAARGQQGKDILAAEKQLKGLGLDPGKVDGKFDRQTEAAVAAFKKSRADLPDTDRNIDAATGRALRTQGRDKAMEADLKALGFDPGRVDGRLDASTSAAVKRFQKKEKLAVTGRADTGTRKAIAKRANEKEAAESVSGPKPKGTAAKAAWYKALVEKNGGKWRTGTNEVNIIGLRGQGVDGKRNGNTFNQWNDTMAYVWKGKDGKMHVREFQATTDPGVTGGPGKGRDVNGDGRGDIAHLRPGSYPYRVGTHNGSYGAGNPTYNLQVDRDTNHNGYISKAERDASKRRDDRGYGINIHWGDGYTVGGWSEGCQVIKGSYDSFRRNVTPIMEMNRGQMYYTLIDQSR